MSNKHPQVKVGDQLAFRWPAGGLSVHPIERITPSGRIICGPFTLDPDLHVRKRQRYGPFAAEIITREIAAELARQEAIANIRTFKPEKLSDAALLAIAEIIKKEKSE